VTSELAQHTLARLQQALRTRETASLPEVIKLIEELSLRAFSISVAELAEIIGRDTLVTAKVIQAANTFGFNPFGQPVTTVTQAIQVVGFNKVRNLALSMLLLEGAGTGGSEGQRESAALALCSGIIAQSLATRHPGHDAEQAFVFACLRHYGRLLLASFLPEEFERVRQRPVDRSEPEAFRDVFGLTPTDVTLHVLAGARLPRPLLRCLQDHPPSHFHGVAASPEDELTALVTFSGALGEALLSPRNDPAQFASAAQVLRERFATRLGLEPDAVPTLLAAVDQNLRTFSRSYGVSTAIGALTRLEERRRAAAAAPPPPSAPAPDALDTALPLSSLATTAAPVAPAEAPPPAIDAAAVLTDALVTLAALAAGDAPPGTPPTERILVQAVRDAFGLADCIHFSATDTGAFAADEGCSALFAEIRGRPLITAGTRDVPGICLARREDVLIRDTRDEKLRPFLPPWLEDGGPVRSFILLPVQDSAGVAGLLLGVRGLGAPLAPNARELQLLKALRQQAVALRRARRG
jgi:HD-like signal output (HDOD) protein